MLLSAAVCSVYYLFFQICLIYEILIFTFEQESWFPSIVEGLNTFTGYEHVSSLLKHFVTHDWLSNLQNLFMQMFLYNQISQHVCLSALTSHSSRDFTKTGSCSFGVRSDQTQTQDWILVVLLQTRRFTAAVTGQLKASVAQEQKRKFPASCSLTNAGRFIVGYDKRQS